MRRAIKSVAVLPAYNTAKSLRKFFYTFPFELFDEVILVDDFSSDKTFEIAKKIKKIRFFRNDRNLGYGGNLKVCFGLALKINADIVVEIHADREYGFESIPEALKRVKNGSDLVLGNRFAYPVLNSGMLVFKYPFIKLLNYICNFWIGTKIPDLHQGFRVYSRKLLEEVNYKSLADDYSFSFEIIYSAVLRKFSVFSVPVKVNYSGKKRGASFKASSIYFLKVLRILIFFKEKGKGSQKCLFCKDDFSVYQKNEEREFKLYFCSKCLIGFTDPIPKQLSNYYPQNYWIGSSIVYKLKSLVFDFFQKRRVNWVKKYLKESIPGSRIKSGMTLVLDVGSGEGNFSKMLKNDLQVVNLEPEFSKIKNPDVLKVDFLKFKIPFFLTLPKNNSDVHWTPSGGREIWKGLSSEGKFEAITFWESLEHVKNPYEYLKHAKELLKKDGLVFIEYPRFNSFESWLFKRFWFHLDMPRHLFHFTDRGLRDLTLKLGFKVVEQRSVSAFEYSIWGFFASLVKSLGISTDTHNIKRKDYLKLSLLSPLMLIAIMSEIILYAVDQSPIGLIVLKNGQAKKM